MQAARDNNLHRVDFYGFAYECMNLVTLCKLLTNNFYFKA
jgi:hypothetical protein